MSRNALALVPHVDLGALPLKGSRVLTEFRAARQAERRQAAAASEMQAAIRALGGRSLVAHRGPRGGEKPVVVDGAFEVVSGQRFFGAGETDRLTAGWKSANTGINADLERALEPMRSRSRNWAVNTDLGRRYISMVKVNVVGHCLPRLQVRATLADGKTLDTIANQAIEDHFRTWCERGNCEISGKLSLLDVAHTNVASWARDGEYLNRRIRSKSLPYGYALQVLDVDRLPINSSVKGALDASGGNVIRMGVEINALGQTAAYHLYSAHPSDGHWSAQPNQIERVSAADIFHGFLVERPEQVRGYPWTHAILKTADGLAKYERYALVAAQFGAMKMGFYTIDKDAPSGEAPNFDAYKDATGQLVTEVEPGMLESLPPGVDFKGWDSPYPHQQFGDFTKAYKHGLAAGLDVAHHNLTGDMAGVNYSSARIAELQERDMWRLRQKGFIEGWLLPVFREWLLCALAQGAITLPSGARLPADRYGKFAAAASFQPRGWAWVDPEADIKASIAAIGADLRSERMIADEQGVDLDQVLSDRKAYLDACAGLGIDPLTGVQAPAPGGKAAAPTGAPA